MNSLKIRFWRSVITASGIVLSIAFLCYSLVGLWLPGHADTPDLARQEHYKQVWLVCMSLLVAIVGIMNAMLMSVTERFKEIGTMKCLGALDSLIVRLFMIEAVFHGRGVLVHGLAHRPAHRRARPRLPRSRAAARSASTPS